MKEIDLELQLENALFIFWMLKPEPKKKYTSWYYGEGGVRDAIDNWKKVPKSGTIKEDK